MSSPKGDYKGSQTFGTVLSFRQQAQDQPASERIGPVRLPELLAPAGTREKLEVALHYGADAVYLGGAEFGLRSMSGNFSLKEMGDALQRTHDAGAKAYLTVNAYLHNHDLQRLEDFLDQALCLPFDAYIISDPGVLQLIRQKAPQTVLHLSTQANTTNWLSASFWQEQGFSRINLARETTLQGIQETRSRTTVELEVFVHGALCMAYSGRCLISSIMTGRSANSGECTHPCRWSYALLEESRPGEYYPVEEDANGTLFFNSRDLCLLDHLPSLVAAGVNSLKIEGRMKGVHYLGTTVRVYRQALDRLAHEGPEAFTPDPSWHRELAAVSHRGYTTGFLFGPPRNEAQNYTPASNRDADFVGIIREIRSDGSAMLEVKGPISSGDELEIIGRSPDIQRFAPPLLMNDAGAILDRANPNTRLILPPGFPLSPYDLVRRRTISIAT